MRVIVLTDGLPVSGSLIGIFEADQATALHEAGNEVLLIVFDSFSIREKRKFGIYQNDDFPFPVKIISYPIGRRPLKICANIATLVFRKVLKSDIIKSFKPDIVHAHFYFQGYVATMCKDIFKCPVVITEHSSLINRSNIRKDIYRVANIGYHNADGVIVVSNALKEKVMANFGIEATVIPNIVDTGVFQAGDSNKNNKCRFISVGNLVPVKNMTSLIEAFISSFSVKDDVTLTIYGDGPERERLKRKIDGFGYGNKIKLAGRVSRTVISKALTESDCFVLASKSETFGVSYIEAMATGLPVIATRCGGPEGFINENCGLLINVDDSSELKQALLYMAENHDKYEKRAIADYARENFSPEDIAGKLILYYEQILGRCIHD